MVNDEYDDKLDIGDEGLVVLALFDLIVSGVFCSCFCFILGFFVNKILNLRKLPGLKKNLCGNHIYSPLRNSMGHNRKLVD